jgi:hypothetical protein
MRPLAACGIGGKPLAAERTPPSIGSSPDSGWPSASVSRIVSASVATTVRWRSAADGAAGSLTGVKTMDSLLSRAR